MVCFLFFLLLCFFASVYLYRCLRICAWWWGGNASAGRVRAPLRAVAVSLLLRPMNNSFSTYIWSVATDLFTWLPLRLSPSVSVCSSFLLVMRRDVQHRGSVVTESCLLANHNHHNCHRFEQEGRSETQHTAKKIRDAIRSGTKSRVSDSVLLVLHSSFLSVPCFLTPDRVRCQSYSRLRR